MNRIDQLFSTGRKEILSIFMMAGYPRLQDTAAIIRSLEKYGADMVEIGMPFSDPLADGPVIQQCSQAALKNGMNIRLLFDQLADIRSQVSIPLVLMGYLNPVLQFGVERFLGECSKAGIDGVILPDLPPDEYEMEYRSLFEDYHIHHILLITPQSGEDRIRRIAVLSGGFLYMVADAATTGARDLVTGPQVEYFRRMSEMKLPLPLLAGFGISNHETFQKACEYSRGAIIGSAFLKALSGEGDLDRKIKNFLGSVIN
jgi:tryptophan synthase alpha chain